jgi:sodium-coupled neutral amino acid transporter 9
LFTISLIIVSLLVQVLSLNVAAVVSFDGAVIGFVLAYLIPVYMHLKCLYHVYTP